MKNPTPDEIYATSSNDYNLREIILTINTNKQSKDEIKPKRSATEWLTDLGTIREFEEWVAKDMQRDGAAATLKMINDWRIEAARL